MGVDIMAENFILHCKFFARDCLNILKVMRPTIRRIKKSISENKQIIYLLDTPTYLNLGDQAIGYAERCFFEKFYPDAEIVEIEGYMVKYYLPFIRKYVKTEDIVAHIGGGNFGDLYPAIENNRLRILKKLRNHRVVIFPQTIYYTDSDTGRESLKQMQKTIANNPDVLIVAREKTSFEFAKKMFQAEIVLLPDIVLFLDEQNDKKRIGVLACLRDDEEKKDNNGDYVKNILERLSLPYEYTDTTGKMSFPISAREAVLSEKWDEFRGAELVITDRLHGMIFSVITGTPCIVFPNNNFKIKSFYETWLKDYKQVRFLEDIKLLEEAIAEMLYRPDQKQIRYEFSDYYQELAKIIVKRKGHVK